MDTSEVCENSSVPQRKFGAKEPQVFVVSYPKTGRTWLRIMVAKYLCDRYGWDERNVARSELLIERCGLPRTLFMHGQAGFDQGIHWRDLDPNRAAFRGKRVMLLGRDIRDTMVSAYLWATKRLRIFDGSISDFIRDGHLGAPKFLAFYRHWYEARGIPAAFEFVRYEDIHRDPARILANTLTFIGAPQLDQAFVQKAVAFASIPNLRRMELEGHTLTLKDREGPHGGDPEAFKFRRGQVGRFIDYLSQEDISYLDALNQAEGCPLTR